MRVKVRLFANFRSYSRVGGHFTQEVPEGKRLGELLDELGIPREAPKVVLVNGRQVPLEEALKEGDEVTVFPPVEGG